MATNKAPALIKGITPAGTASYPWLTKPDTKFKAEGEYKVTLRLGADETQDIRTKIDDLIEQKMEEVKADLKDKSVNGKDGKAKASAKQALTNLKTPSAYKDTVDDNGDPTGDYEFTFKSKASFTNKDGKVITRTIPIFDSKKNKVEVSVYGGSVLKVAFEYLPYYNAATGDVGVSLRLSAVQVITLVNGSGGSSAAGFGFGDEDGEDLSAESKPADASEAASEDDSDPDF